MRDLLREDLAFGITHGGISINERECAELLADKDELNVLRMTLAIKNAIIDISEHQINDLELRDIEKTILYCPTCNKMVRGATEQVPK